MRLTFLLLALTLSACSQPGDIQKTTAEDAGAVSAKTLNELANTNPDSLIKIAYALDKSGNHVGALRVYKQAKAANPEDIRADIGMVRIYQKAGQNQQAKSILDKIRDKADLSPQIREEIIKLYMENDDYDVALAMLEPELTNPDQVKGQLLSMAGILYELKGNGTRARSFYDLAQARGDGNSESFSKLLAYSFAMDGSYETAIAILQPALNNPDTQEMARLSLGYIYALSGQHKPALKLLENAKGYDFMQKRKAMVKMLPLMTRLEQTEALIFDRVKAETIKRLLPLVQK